MHHPLLASGVKLPGKASVHVLALARMVKGEADSMALGGTSCRAQASGTLEDIDLLIEQPTIGEVVSVQAKSRASQAALVVSKALPAREHMNDASIGLTRTFFVCHSPDGVFPIGGASGAHLWTGEYLANVAVKSGLFEWLMDRAG